MADQAGDSVLRFQLTAKTCVQVRSLMGQIRPDRQTLLFSATMPRKVERLVRDALTAPIRITVGEVGGANEDVKQVRLQALLRRATSLLAGSRVTSPEVSMRWFRSSQ